MTQAELCETAYIKLEENLSPVVYNAMLAQLLGMAGVVSATGESVEIDIGKSNRRILWNPMSKWHQTAYVQQLLEIEVAKAGTLWIATGRHRRSGRKEWTDYENESLQKAIVICAILLLLPPDSKEFVRFRKSAAVPLFNYQKAILHSAIPELSQEIA